MDPFFRQCIKDKIVKMDKNKNTGGKDEKDTKELGKNIKARVALEALKEQKTLSELSSKYEISVNLISKWKSHMIKNAEQLFDSTQRHQKSFVDKSEVSKLYEQIGKQNIELEWQKKIGYND